MEVEEAFRLWREIPSDKLLDAVEEAIIRAGAFPATNGLVVKAWRELQADPVRSHEEAQRAIRAENTARYLGVPSPDRMPPTDEERKEIAEGIRKVREMLMGAA